MRSLGGTPLTRATMWVLLLVASIAVVQTVYVGPRTREAKALQAQEQRLRAELLDLERGAGEIQGWTPERPMTETAGARRALPAPVMVSGFLRSLGPIAGRHGIATESIEPMRLAQEVESGNGTSGPATYRKVALRFRVAGAYQDLAEYVAEVERMDQAVLVRSVAIRFDAARYPRLESEIVFWIYGAS